MSSLISALLNRFTMVLSFQDIKGLTQGPAAILSGAEMQRSGVHAIALAAGLGAVGKQMSQMRIALRAANFDAMHMVRIIIQTANGVGAIGAKEARPAAAGIVFTVGIEQGAVAAQAVVYPLLAVMQQSAAKRRLGATLLSDIALHFG